MKEKLKQVETKSKLLEKEIKMLKTANKTLERYLIAKTLAIKKIFTILSSLKATNRVKATKPALKNYV